METFYFEMTDTFGHDLNYCWLKRFTVKAKNLKGALIKISRRTGLNFNFNGSYYKAKKACIGLYEYPSYDLPDIRWLERSETIE